MQLPANINGTNGILYFPVTYPFMVKSTRKNKTPNKEDIKLETIIDIIFPFKKIATQME